ncbi:MAG: hypothetical protein KDK36_17215 [Leptospiraceae bacterium]|nr:hypothetical protein [Leptospiraceae bacterium]
MNRNVIFFLVMLSFVSCATSAENTTSSNEEILGSNPGGAPTQYFQPAGEKEKIIDENGKEVQISDIDPEPFREKSTNGMEAFRVIMSSDSYLVRQIRHSSTMRRKPDNGGDKLMMEEISKFDKLSFVDDGLVIVKLNSKTGKLENVNFHKRIPKIADLAKIIQNDATRWAFEHKNEEPDVKSFLVTYYIVLKKKASKEEVKGMLKEKAK